MIDPTSTLAEKRDKQFSDILEKMYAAAQPGAVFSEPVTAGNYTVITASEVMVGGGFGLGPPCILSQQPEETPQVQLTGGGGGGGGSRGRPVATISIGPNGVTIKPIVDVARIALAGIAMGGSLLLLLRKRLR